METLIGLVVIVLIAGNIAGVANFFMFLGLRKRLDAMDPREANRPLLRELCELRKKLEPQPEPESKLKRVATPPPLPAVKTEHVLLAPKLKLQAAAPPLAEPEPGPGREPGRFESAARVALGKIWNWIVVGEEYRRPNVAVEYAVAANWLLRVGIAIFVIGMGFFLRYSIDQGWLGPVARVALSVLVGSGMVAGGVWQFGRKYHLFGQGLVGGGLATLYFSIFAATNFYHLTEPTTGYLLMGLVTVCAGIIAVRQDAILVAVLGIIGGYGTPLMLPVHNLMASQLGYLALLALGVFGIAAYKNWRLLNTLCFVATYSVALWITQGNSSVMALQFYTLYFVIFSSLIFAYNLIRKQSSTILEVIALLANAGVFFVLAREICDRFWGETGVALLTFSLSLYYAGHFVVCLRRQIRDRGLVMSFLGLSSLFLAVTIPLYLSREWITAVWAVQALTMLWMASKLESQFLRHLSYLLYALVLGRFFVIDLHAHYFAGVGGESYVALMLQRLVVFSVPIAAVAAGYRLLGHHEPVTAGPIPSLPEGNDIREVIGRNRALQAGLALLVAMAFIFLHFELNSSLGHFYDPLRMPVLSMLWVVLCLAALWGYGQSESRLLLVLLCIFTGGLAVKLLVFDLGSWHFLGQELRYTADAFGFGLMRLLDFSVITVFLAFTARILLGREDRVARSFMIAALALPMLFLTLELNTFLYLYQPELRPGGVSILWAVFALAFVQQGMTRRLANLRYVGLAIFCIVVGKIFLHDLAQLAEIYRIIAFVVLGLIILGGAFLYVHFQRQFTDEKPA
jgi:uncharacterized membrane protein